MSKEIDDRHYLQRLIVIGGNKVSTYIEKQKKDIISIIINRDFYSQSSEAIWQNKLAKLGYKMPDYNDYTEPEYIDMDFFKRQIIKHPEFKETGFTFYNGRKYIRVNSEGKIIG